MLNPMLEVKAAIGNHWSDVPRREGHNIYVWYNWQAESWFVRDRAGDHASLSFANVDDINGAVKAAKMLLEADGTLPA